MAQLKTKFNSSVEFIGPIMETIAGYPEFVQDTFSRMLQDKYTDVADKLLYTRYGDRELRSEDDILIAMEVRSYLLSNAKYFEKCLEYIDAEYNPVENYSQIEEETIKSEYDEVNNHGTNTKAEDTFRHGQHTDQDVYPTYTDQNTIPQYTDTTTTGVGGYDVTQHTAKIKTTTTPPGDTNTTSVAPFESDTFHNKEKSVVSHTEGSETVEKLSTGSDNGDDKTSYSQKVDTVQHGQHTDQYIKGAHTDQHTYEQYDDISHVGDTEDGFTNVTDEREDNVTRKLTRSGNIGVQTAAQMMTMDKDFWQHFGWLQDMAHDLANILTIGVWAI